MHKEFFGYEHPIVCSAMTCVSDINLAIACAKAEIVPSLTTAPFELRLKQLQFELDKFTQEMNHCHLILGVAIPDNPTLENFIVKLIEKYKISHCELIENANSDKKFVERLRELNCSVMKKVATIETKNLGFDALVLNGTESAGYSHNLKTKDYFNVQKQFVPANKLIPSGGIASKAQIDYYINSGALAVSVGTLFAMSEESSIDISTKKTMLEKTSSDLSRMKLSGLQGLIYRDIEPEQKKKRTIDKRLQRGVSGNLEEGVIFAGTGIDFTNELLPVQEIVRRLTADDS
jgi:NAD(P)H-dependent flavin oxidoreductase YrpB (nitropropane dioxygenase family)